MSELALKQQVETLYQQTAASSQEFCIDLEGEAPDGRHVWEWAHLSTVGNARRSVERKKQLIEGEHYLVIRSEIQVQHQGGLRSTEAVRIVFSFEGFELWLLMLDTPRGHQIRQFFRECHKRLQLGMSQPTALNATIDRLAETVRAGLAGLYHSNTEIKQELGDLGQRVARLEEQQCDRLYVFVRSKDLTIKLGYTADIETRRKAHEARGFKLVGLVTGTRQRETKIKQLLRTQGIKPKNGTEEYQLTPEVVEAFAQQGLPVGDLCCTKPKNGQMRNTKHDGITPSLFP